MKTQCTSLNVQMHLISQYRSEESLFLKLWSLLHIKNSWSGFCFSVHVCDFGELFKRNNTFIFCFLIEIETFSVSLYKYYLNQWFIPNQIANVGWSLAGRLIETWIFSHRLTTWEMYCSMRPEHYLSSIYF